MWNEKRKADTIWECEREPGGRIFTRIKNIPPRLTRHGSELKSHSFHYHKSQISSLSPSLSYSPSPSLSYCIFETAWKQHEWKSVSMAQSLVPLDFLTLKVTHGIDLNRRGLKPCFSPEACLALSVCLSLSRSVTLFSLAWIFHHIQRESRARP